MRKIALLVFTIFATFCQAQNAKSILDKAADAFKKAGQVEIMFQYKAGDIHSGGKIDVDNARFFADLGASKAWYNGTTMWHYVQTTGECTVTNPTGNEASRLNPHSFITLYKSGYECKMGKSTKAYYEVEMIGGKKSAYKNIVVRLGKTDYKPLYIKTQTAKSTMEIEVTSYKKNCKFPANIFSFNKKEFPAAEVIDLR